MSGRICIAQSVDELKFVLDKCEGSVISVPLNLQTQLYCMKNNLEFYKPINFIDSNFHRDAILESENLINKIDISQLKQDSYKKIYNDLFNPLIIKKLRLYPKRKVKRGCNRS